MRDTRIKELETVAALSSLLLIFFYISEKPIFVFLSLGLLLMSLIFKKLISRLVWVWNKFTNIIGKIVTRVALFLVFFLVLTPIAFIYRRFNRNSLGLKKLNAVSYFHIRNHTYNQRDFEKNW